jgi:hypothetical protein
MQEQRLKRKEEMRAMKQKNQRVKQDEVCSNYGYFNIHMSST